MPGQLYTVNDSLQEILTRQKLEARQAMLDELSRKELETKWRQQELENTRNRDRDALSKRQVEASILNQTENTQSQREAREALSEGRVLGQLSAGQDITSLSPEVGAVVDKYGKRKTTLSPRINGETEDTQDVRSTYLGSPKEQFELNQLDRMKQALENPNLDPEVRKAIQFQLSGATGSLPAGAFGRAETADIQNYEYDVAHGYKGSIQQWRNEDANRKNPVQRPATFGYAGTDPKTNLPLTLENTTGNFYLPGRVPYSGPVAPKPTTTTNKYPPVLSDNASQDLADLRARTGGWVGGQVRRQEAARIQNGIGNAKVDPQVRQVALQIISSSTYDNKDAMEIVQEYRRNLGASPSPQDINLVNQLEALLIQTIGIKPRE